MVMVVVYVYVPSKTRVMGAAHFQFQDAPEDTFPEGKLYLHFTIASCYNVTNVFTVSLVEQKQ